ncbi:MAG: hypothetical protein DKM22_06300 [Candidatus Melainabacteria bacterium]|nr:MAG: hypothetical protein DKM22_06300 [Candidatus Melainabacteria bacterium]
MDKANTCEASLRVFRTFLLLLEKDVTIKEISDYLKSVDEDGNIFTREVILKYLNTLRIAGINISRNGNRYSILKCPPNNYLTTQETEGMLFLDNYDYPKMETKRIVSEFLLKVEKRFSPFPQTLKDYYKEPSRENDEERNLIEKFQKYIDEKLKLKISVNENQPIIVTPIAIKCYENNIFFNVYCSSKGRSYDLKIDEVKIIEQLPVTNNGALINYNILFKLKGRLASGYVLKNGERIIESLDNGEIIVLNNKEPENSLLKRLMRYGILCEVISPSDTRNNMKNLIQNTINLYQ